MPFSLSRPVPPRYLTRSPNGHGRKDRSTTSLVSRGGGSCRPTSPDECEFGNRTLLLLRLLNVSLPAQLTLRLSSSKKHSPLYGRTEHRYALAPTTRRASKYADQNGRDTYPALLNGPNRDRLHGLPRLWSREHFLSPTLASWALIDLRGRHI